MLADTISGRLQVTELEHEVRPDIVAKPQIG